MRYLDLFSSDRRLKILTYCFRVVHHGPFGRHGQIVVRRAMEASGPISGVVLMELLGRVDVWAPH